MYFTYVFYVNIKSTNTLKISDLYCIEFPIIQFKTVFGLPETKKIINLFNRVRLM